MPRLVIEDNGVLYSLDGEQLNGMPPTNGNGDVYDLIEKANFGPRWLLQSADAQPVVGNGNLVGSYVIDKLRREVKVRYHLKLGSESKHGVPSGEGTSRYYFTLPDEVPDSSKSVNESSSVHAWIKGEEFSGSAVVYSRIDRAVIVTLGGVPWSISHPVKMGAGHYIEVTIEYDY